MGDYFLYTSGAGRRCPFKQFSASGKFRVLRAQDSYTPLVLNCQKRQHLPAAEVYEKKSPKKTKFWGRIWRKLWTAISSSRNVEKVQQFATVTSIGSLPPKTLEKSRGALQSPAETPQNPLRGKFPRRASRRVVPLGW